VPSFARSVEAIEDAIARDRADPLIAETALPRLYHHGAPVERAVVLYHGFTTAPQQFDELARRLHARGCNVYVPRIPLHGRRDRLTRALAGLNGPLLAGASTASYHLACGLGARVCAAGLSLGGSIALYLALTQPIDLAVPIAPFLMPIGVPDRFGLTVMRAVALLPDFYVWWDPRRKQNSLPLHAYPGFPSHALAQCVFFGDLIVASTAAPRA
jgi:alpha-beta hydrolase superfamily lysophospholipase